MNQRAYWSNNNTKNLSWKSCQTQQNCLCCRCGRMHGFWLLPSFIRLWL